VFSGLQGEGGARNWQPFLLEPLQSHKRLRGLKGFRALLKKIEDNVVRVVDRQTHPQETDLGVLQKVFAYDYSSIDRGIF
jgi:hypothetical protein